jgi:hypothetical protein
LTILVRESSALEPLVKGYLDASNTQHYKDSLNILFLNGLVFEVFENSGICCLISLYGSDNSIDKCIDLIEGKAKTNIAPFFKEIFKTLLPQFMIIFKQVGAWSQEGLDEIQVQTRMVTTFMTTMPELQKKMKDLTGLFINGTFLFSDLLLAAIYKGFIEIRNSHLRAGISSSYYEEMIQQLTKLEIIEPKIRVSICPKCMNNELVISKYPLTNEVCPKCGSEWSSSVLYLFKEQLGKIKALNNDLPLFISSYLKNQLSLKTIGEETEIFPNAVIKLGEKIVEIDVYIPKYKIGIECKNYLSSSMPDTIARAKSIAGELRKQILNYREAGIEQIYIIANLPTKTFEQVNKTLKETFSYEEIPLLKILIIRGNPDELLKFLNVLSSSLSTEANKKLEMFFQKELPNVSNKTKELKTD